MNPLELAKQAAADAGEILKKSFRTLGRSDAAFKSERDPVTRLDRESEKLIVRRIADAFPKHAVLAEEGDGDASGADCRWIIDPLDGTVNYLHGSPVYAVSIALEENGTLVMGVINVPQLGEMFWASQGKGAFLNGEKISVSPAERLIDSVLATGFAYNRRTAADNNLANFSALAMAARGVRRMGAAAVDMAYVAAGILDGFWEIGLQPWDVAAGAVIIREAGGKVTDFAGKDGFLFEKNIVASNGLVHDALRERLAPFPPRSEK